ncbi:AAA family ATPase [Candidatus Marinamargulisbacteria bacterium SCGC AAA071-K20]|nr:AAA family ATPase [Candidatus Marinamargulisbacteria bacterium SCGC AAA071-K20]
MSNTQLFPELETPQSVANEHAKKSAPLSYQLSPKTFDDYQGQQHLIAPGKPLRVWIEQDKLNSTILWGPPGVGKTALARLMALNTSADFVPMNAVMAKVQDIREAIKKGKANQTIGKKTIVFIDEIHRFNKAQQDALLPDLERGVITLVGATTENPFFSVNPSILSRVQLFELQPLNESDLKNVLDRALKTEALSELIPLEQEIESLILRQCHGDARRLINLLESVAITTEASGGKLSKENLKELIQQTGTLHSDDSHYDITSAFIKSVRGSDVDASLYWLARLLKGGEDPRFIARRLLILASEDIGNAQAQALPMAAAALQTVQFIGMPESKYTLSQVTIYLAQAPKSNAATVAITKALAYIDEGNIHAVPNHLRDSHHAGLKKIGRGEGYKYPHNYLGAKVDQEYWPGKTTFYSALPGKD